MERVAEIVSAYCQRLGATPPAARDDGTYVLQFDGKYEVRFIADGRDRLLLRADLTALKRDRFRQDALHRLLRINLALSGRKHSTLSLEGSSDVPFLYDVLTVGPAEEAASLKAITTFVNEVAAFRKALEHGH